MNLLPKSYKKTIRRYLILLFAVSISYSQNFKNYTIANGLPSNHIHCIHKDANGLMWFGTDAGLCTFDGLNFKVVNESNGFNHNIIWKIIEDEKNNLWISTYGKGFAKFNGSDFTFFDSSNGLVNDYVRSMYSCSKSGFLVLGTENGLSVFDGKNFKNLKQIPNNYSGLFQVNFISNYNGKIIFGVNYEYVYELEIDEQNIQNSKIKKFYYPKTQNYTGFISGDYFYSRGEDLNFEIHDLKNKTKKSLGPCPTIWQIVEANNNDLYAAGWEVNLPQGGLLKINNTIVTDLSIDLNLPTNKFWSLFYDKKTQQLWTGSIDQGVFIINLNDNIKTPKWIEKSELNCIFIDKNQNIWLGGNNIIAKKTEKKIILLTKNDVKNHIFNKIRGKHDDREQSVRKFYKISDDFNCTSIIQDEEGVIWALTNFGLLGLDQNLNLIHYQFIVETSGKMEIIDDNSLMVSQNYNFVYEVPKNNLRNYKKINLNSTPVVLNANKIVKKNEQLWITTRLKGLFLYEKNKLISLNDKGYINENNLTDVIVDKDNTIIISTKNGKVIFGKWNDNKFSEKQTYTPQKPHIGNSVYFVRQYKNYLLIGTNKGLNIIKDDQLIKFINQEEGLKNVVYTDALVDENKNILYLTSIEGLTSLNLEEIVKPMKVNSPILMNWIKVNNALFPKSHALKLKSTQNNIELSFGSNNNYNATKNYYRFKIKGANNEWSEYTQETNLRLVGLKSGEYSISIEGKNLGTGEDLLPLNIDLHILRPFWLSWWFVLSVCTCIALLLYGYVKNKIKEIKEKAEIQKRIAETKLLALQSQMNPHFIFNAMNSIQNYVIDNKVDDALFYISEFSKLIRQTLDFSSKKFIYLHEEFEYLSRYIELENLRRKIKVDVDLSFDNAIDINENEIPPMLIQPIIENVFIHAFDSSIKNPKIQIQFSKSSNKIVCVVTDNGKGIVLSNKNSKGLKLVEERIELLTNENSGVIEILKTSIGLSVKIEIPMR